MAFSWTQNNEKISASTLNEVRTNTNIFLSTIGHTYTWTRPVLSVEDIGAVADVTHLRAAIDYAYYNNDCPVDHSFHYTSANNPYSVPVWTNNSPNSN